VDKFIYYLTFHINQPFPHSFKRTFFIPVHSKKYNNKIMPITQEAAAASIIPSALATTKLANSGTPSGIFADPSIGDECFPGEPTLTVGNVLNKLANKCAAFQMRLAQGERVQGVSF
jgi:hypothetical protein